jgi:ankyrin repeat protein
MKKKALEKGATEAHIAAREGYLDGLRQLVEVNEEIVNAQDQNGWTPLHEAVRSKNIEVVRFLLQNGADVNLRTIQKDGGKQHPGGAALYWALKFNDEDDPLLALLLSYGAKNYVPLKEEEAPLPEREQEL